MTGGRARQPPLFAPNGARLDEIDLELLRGLSCDGRAANQDLAQVVELSPSACAQRQRRLETGGAIKRYVAEVDETIFNQWSLLWVSVELYPGAARGQFESALWGCAHVLEAHELVGRLDYLLKVALVSTSAWPDVKREIDPAGGFIKRVDVAGGVRTAKSSSPHPLLGRKL